MDLVLDERDGDSVIVIGMTAEPELWVNRLYSALAQMVTESPNEGNPEIRIEHIGSWSYRQERDSVVSFLIGVLHGSTSYAR